MIVMLTTLLSISVTAETATFTVTGMDCGGCKKIVTKALCDDKIISATLSKCEVSVDEKTKTGTVILKSKDSVKIDAAMIESKIHASGENYKVSKTEISK
jgi:copper chaperone CopZ